MGICGQRGVPRAGRYEMLAAMLSSLGVEPDER
jgi:hypothetical protein